jgi:hypothetical protein
MGGKGDGGETMKRNETISMTEKKSLEADGRKKRGTREIERPNH